MHLVNKTLALILSFSLLGQSALWAAPSSESRQPQNLAEYQQRAKEDIQRAPWIQREGKYILGIGGVTVGLLVTQQVIHNRRVNAIHAEYQSLIEAARKNSQKEIQEQLIASQNELAATKKELRLSNIKAEGWKKSAQTQRAKREAAEQAAKQREALLQDKLTALQERFDTKKSHYTDLVRYSLKLDEELTKYEKLFNKAVPEEERLALRKQLAQEPWLLKTTKAQQEEFLYIIDQASTYRRGTYKEAGDGFMRYLIRQAMEKNMPLYERLIGMLRHVYHSKNIPAVVILVGLGLSAQNVKAQKMADRVNTNFDLFLNATPQELAEMEKDPELRKICVQGAEALHLMSNMTEEESSLLRQSVTNTTTNNTPTRNSINLAR